MREDELQGRLEGQELLLVPHDQVVGAVVCLGVAPCVPEHVHGAVADLLSIDGEVPVVDVLGCCRQIDALEEVPVVWVLR